jgi:hypothetical protein
MEKELHEYNKRNKHLLPHACSSCKASVYFCEDPACKCFHHAFDAFAEYEHERTDCTIEDVVEFFTK